MTANQMKYLLALIHQPGKKRNQSDVARIFGVNKSTVSRALVEAVKQGILSDGENGYELTGYGKDYVRDYEDCLNSISTWLLSMGADPEDVRNDSYAFMESCSERTLRILQNRGNISKIYQGMRPLENGAAFSGAEITAFIEPGEYHVPFVFYRSGKEEALIPRASMANEAFYHPATLVISRTGSYICLRIRNVVQRSKVNGEELDGKLKTMKYGSGEKEKTVMLNDEKVYIPIEVMQFYYIKQDNILRGYMEFKMSCTVGDIHMPESAAVLMVYL